MLDNNNQEIINNISSIRIELDELNNFLENSQITNFMISLYFSSKLVIIGSFDLIYYQ